MSRPRTRFAPSPNGRLHLGHAYSALFSAQKARELQGEFLLRIEDIDHLRCKREHRDAALADLAWLGLSWPDPVRIQSQHMHEYTFMIDRLERLRLLYPCFCTRTKLQQVQAVKDPDGTPLYPGYCRLMTSMERNRRMTAGEPYALRLDMAKAILAGEPGLSFQELGQGPDGQAGLIECDPKMWGDLVLARKDIATSYHIAVVHDDAVQGITHVTRGVDLFHATSIHRLLQSILELPVPRYIHHALVPDEAGRKLSKSAGDLSLAAIREGGTTPQQIRSQLGF